MSDTEKKVFTKPEIFIKNITFNDGSTEEVIS
jgi:hypothetical protein